MSGADYEGVSEGHGLEGAWLRGRGLQVEWTEGSAL